MLNIKNNRECFFDNYLIDEEKTTAPALLHKRFRGKRFNNLLRITEKKPPTIKKFDDWRLLTR